MSIRSVEHSCRAGLKSWNITFTVLNSWTSAAVIWNTIHMQKIVDQLRAAGETVKDEDIARTWPLLHAHIIPNGMYDFSSC